jgi:hypothetical protein
MQAAKAKKLAVKYLQEQADIMGKFGGRPKLSGKVYRKALRGTIQTIQILSTPIPKSGTSNSSTKFKMKDSSKNGRRRKVAMSAAKPSVAARQMAEA